MQVNNRVRWVCVSLGMVAFAAAVGCAGPAPVAGDYSVNITNGENGCALDNWMVGETAAAIPFVVTQSEDQVQLDVDGASGVALELLLGSSLFNGQVDGSSVTAALIGSNSARQGECSYTITVDLEASVRNDFMEGALTWRAVTNGHPDCATLETCRNLQAFNGSRPPTTD